MIRANLKTLSASIKEFITVGSYVVYLGYDLENDQVLAGSNPAGGVGHTLDSDILTMVYSNVSGTTITAKKDCTLSIQYWVESDHTTPLKPVVTVNLTASQTYVIATSTAKDYLICVS